jgi:negative regulator of flagellin synthesis FlgM
MDVQMQKSLGGVPAPPLKKNGSAEAGAGPPAAPAVAEEEAGKPSLLVAGLTGRLLAEPAVDSDRVSRVSGEIQSGAYQADPQRAANKIVAMELSFG